MISFYCNKDLIETDINPAATVLDFIRNYRHLTGTKEGCREGDCGACTVLVGKLKGQDIHYDSVNSCIMPLVQVNGKYIITIEGLCSSELTLLQQEFINEAAVQCGFCTPGFLISLTAYLLNHESYDYNDAVDSVAGNICRCTGHIPIKRALKSVIESLRDKRKSIKPDPGNLSFLINNGIIPEYFYSVHEKLKRIKDRLGEKETNTPVDRINTKGLYLAGGTDLYIQKASDLLNSEIDFEKDNGNGKSVWLNEDKCFIDAGLTISGLQESGIIQKIIPDIKEYLKLFGSQPIRNRATIGGNIINASPIGDITCILLALDANLHFTGNMSERTVPLKKFFKGYKILDKSSDEILNTVSFKLPNDNFHFSFEKVSKRTHLDIASVNTAIGLQIKNNIITDANISAGGVAPVPFYFYSTRDYLIAKSVDKDTVLRAIDLALSEVKPIDDVRGSKAYKTLLLRQLLAAHFNKFIPEFIEPEDLL